MLKAVHPDLRAVCFGADRHRREPLPDWVDLHINPPQDRLRTIYGRCDVWLCTSYSEGFGLPALEAMACRCPVVSTRVGGPMDFIEEGVNGHLVDIGDAAALADRAARVLALDPADWQCMSDAALATATRYTWDDATELFERALLRGIDGSRGSRTQNGGNA